MADPLVIDTRMHGYEGITACYVVAGEKVALVETGAKSSSGNVLAALGALGVTHLDYIVVTHIHLDHAGAAGTLAHHFPDATICVHGLGAPHLIDPTKLWASATRIYGAAMDSLWGGIDPVDERRIRVIADGDVIDLGGKILRTVATPGHASHHHAFLDESTGDLFTGDALGVYMQDPLAMRPTTPPPELDVETYVRSIETMRALAPRRLCFTHFGIHEHDDAVYDESIALLRKWEGWVREARTKTHELDEVTSIVEREAAADREGTLNADQINRLEQTTSYRMNVMGYMRYLERLEG